MAGRSSEVRAVPGTVRTIRGCLGALVVFGGLAAGCQDTRRFDPDSRAACFDALWATLQRQHADRAAIARLSARSAETRARIRAAATRRQYLVELARFLAQLGDPHASFDDLGPYWYQQTGASAGGVAQHLDLAGGRFWLGFQRDAILSDTSGHPLIEPGKLYELVAVEDVPASTAAVGVLSGPPGDFVHVTICDAENREETVPLRCPLPRAARRGPPPTYDQSVRRTVAREGPKAYITGGRWPDNIGYIWIGSLHVTEVVAQFDRQLNALRDTRALVLDLRGNSGGERLPVEGILGRFVTGIQRYGAAEIRLPNLLLFGPRTWPLTLPGVVWGRGPTYRKPVIVLVDYSTMSAAEILAAALRDLCGATLVGERTAGAGAAIDHVTLPDGLCIQYGAFLIRERDGGGFEGSGIEPDILVPCDVGAIRRGGATALSNWQAAVCKAALDAANRLAPPSGSAELNDARNGAGNP